MQFKDLLKESKNYLKKTGYLREADEDEDQAPEGDGSGAEPAPETSADTGGGGIDDLSWLGGGGGDEGGEAEGEGAGGDPTAAGPEAGGGGAGALGVDPTVGAGGGGGAGGPLGQGSTAEQQAPQGGAQPQEQPQEEKSVTDMILPQAPQAVLNNEAKVQRLNKVLDTFFSNLGNASIAKDMSIDEVMNEIGGLMTVDEKSKKEIANYILTRDRKLISKLKKLRNIKIDQNNADLIHEQVDKFRNVYLMG